MRTTAPDARIDHLRGLLAVSQAVRAGDDLTTVLAAIARAICETLGFAYAVVNLYRPAWDDFQVVVVHGSDGAADLLMGQITTLPDWSAMLHPRFERHETFLIPHGEVDWEADRIACHVPAPREHAQSPGGWHPEDALLIPLRATSGALLGIVSADDPIDGRRPTDAEREVLAALSAHAAVAIESAQAHAEVRRHHAAVEHLLRVSAPVTAESGPADALTTACATIHDALGFEKVCVLLADADRRLQVVAAVGWTPEQIDALPAVGLGAYAGVLAPVLREDGCVVLPADEVRVRAPGVIPHGHASPRNGRGPRGWRDHWAFAPLQDGEGHTIGLLRVDDPVDHLVPTAGTRQALRAFANHVTAALTAAGRLEDLRRLAEHDPLTGLRNRRTFEPGLEADLDGGEQVALIVCDLDHFKRVNDSLGHEAGDEVLRRFSAVLRACARQADLPTRLGGEEFALVLRDTDAAGAIAVAERLRRALRAEFAGFSVPVTVSVGIAATSPEISDHRRLARAAHRALYAAKRLGRDRCVVYERALAEIVSSPLDGAGREQLAAAILLAETLDLRDGGTARHSQTVARLVERVGRELGWTAPRIERLRVAGLLHDIGKLGISDRTLHKAVGLDPDEWEEIHRHPEIGARILEHANLPDIGGWVLAHHERMDGAGYPHGLAGPDVPLEARVLAVADAYEAMVADRPYRRGLSTEEACRELERAAGTQFDPDIVRAFLRVVGHADAPASVS